MEFGYVTLVTRGFSRQVPFNVVESPLNECVPYAIADAMHHVVGCDRQGALEEAQRRLQSEGLGITLGRVAAEYPTFGIWWADETQPRRFIPYSTAPLVVCLCCSRGTSTTVGHCWGWLVASESFFDSLLPDSDRDQVLGGIPPLTATPKLRAALSKFTTSDLEHRYETGMDAYEAVVRSTGRNYLNSRDATFVRSLPNGALWYAEHLRYGPGGTNSRGAPSDPGTLPPPKRAKKKIPGPDQDASPEARAVPQAPEPVPDRVVPDSWEDGDVLPACSAKEYFEAVLGREGSRADLKAWVESKNQDNGEIRKGNVQKVAGVESAEPIGMTTNDIDIARASFVASAFQVHKDDQGMTDFLRRSCKGRAFNKGFSYATERGSYSVFYRTTPTQRMPARGHPVSSYLRNGSQAIARLYAGRSAKEEGVMVYSPGDRPGKLLGIDGHCWMHGCCPTTDLVGDRERRRKDMCLPATCKFIPDFCEERVQDCPRIATAVSSPVPLCVLSLDSAYYYKDWIVDTLRKRAALGYLTRFVIQAHDLTSVKGSTTLPSPVYDEAYVEVESGMVTHVAKGNLSVYQHPLLGMSKQAWSIPGVSYALVASLDTIKVISLTTGTWGAPIGRAPESAVKQDVVLADVPCKQPAIVAGPVEARDDGPPAPCAHLVEDGNSQERRVTSWDDAPQNLGIANLLSDPSTMLGRELPHGEMVWVGPGGLYCCVGAHRYAGVGAVSLEASLANRVIATCLARRAGGISGKVAASVVEGEMRRSELDPATCINRRAAVEAFAELFLAVYNCHMIRVSGGYGRSLELLRVESMISITPGWRIADRIGLEIDRFKLRLFQSVPPASYKPEPYHSAICFGFRPCEVPANVIIVDSEEEARAQLAIVRATTGGYVPYAALLRDGIPPVMECCSEWEHGSRVTQIGPTFDTRPSMVSQCIHSAFRGLVERQAGNLGGDMSGINRHTVDTISSDLLSVLRLSNRYATAVSVQLTTVLQWLDTYTGTNAQALLDAVEVTTYGPHRQKPPAAVNVFVKGEFHGVVRQEEVEYKAPRVISDRNATHKGHSIGVIPTLVGVVKTLCPEYGASMSPAQVEKSLQEYVRENGEDVVFFATDVSRMDGNTSPAVKGQIADFYKEMLADVLMGCDLDAHERAAGFSAALASRVQSRYVYNSCNHPAMRWCGRELVMHFLGTVASGDFDTTFGNTLLVLCIYFKALARIGRSRHDFFALFAGDDGLTGSCLGDAELLAGAMSDIAVELGMKLTVQRCSFITDDPRPQFCSRVYLSYQDEGQIRVKGMRLLSRALVRFGWTIRRDMRDTDGLLRAKAICEMTYASGLPVLQSLFTATLRRPEVASATLSLEQSQVHTLLQHGGYGGSLAFGPRFGRGEKRRAASALARQVNTDFVEPCLGLRHSFAVYTGISPDRQRDLERFIELSVASPNSYIPDAAMCGLIRKDWL